VGLLNTISIGRRALGAASAGIDVTSQNVANANTVGYSRRKVLQDTVDPIHRRGVWVGQGVSLSGINRASDRLLGVRFVAAAGISAQAQSAQETLSAAEAVFEDTTTTGLSEAWSNFYDSMSELTVTPSDAALRRGVVEAGRTLASTVSRTAGGLQDTVDTIDRSLNDYVAVINSTLSEIAALNKAIGRQGASTGPGDLLDRRDQLIYTLGEKIGARVDLREDGQATVFIGDQAVVTMGEARSIQIAEDATGAAQVYVNAGSGMVRVTDSVAGDVGGRLTARSAIQGWLSDLDAFATAFADAFNTQHSAGFDANGTAGGTFFTYDPTQAAASLEVDAALAADPRLFAGSAAATASAGDDGNLRALLDTETLAIYGVSGAEEGAVAISALVSDVGATVAASASDAEAFSAQLSDLASMREAVSGVDSDEEAIKLVEYQAAYRAAARVLQAGDQLLQTLMTIGA
jgi:flagellar hook-associated protein 1 FlgK